MFPYITIFGKQITLYYIMTMIGIFVAAILYLKEIKKSGKDVNDYIVVGLISAIGLFFGGHILYGLTNINIMFKLITHFNKLTSFKEFIDIFIYIFGGQVFYGGLIGFLTVGYIYLRKKRLDVKLYFDIIAFTIPLFHFFARIGCFLSGCCYGIESKIGFTFTHSLVELANGVKRFPIQLVESSYNLLLFILMYTLYRKDKFKNKLIYLYLILYPIGRFIFEFFRGDEYRGFILGISTSQFISILLIVFAILSLILKKSSSLTENK